MVLPEGSGQPEDSRPKRLVALSVVLVLLSATIALAVATSPADEVALGTTTTTSGEPLPEPTMTTTIDIDSFSIGDVATGERLSWREAPPIGASWPLELLEYRGSLYLFTSDGTPGPRITSTGMQVWNSQDGIQWNEIGEVTEAAVSAVAATDEQLIALGSHPRDGSPHIWTSIDGVDWTPSRLPVDIDSELPTSTWLTDAIVHDDQLILVGSVYPDPQRLIIDRLPPDITDHLDRYGMGFNDGPDGPTIEVYAPLGVVGYSASIEELGVDDEIADALFRSSPSEDTYVWRSYDGAEWVVSDGNGPFLENLWTAPGGELLASGWGNSGPIIWSSPDGVSWDRTDSSMVDVVTSQNDRLIGVRNGADLVGSDDGRSWDSLGSEAVLPQSLPWHLEKVDANSAVIAAIATAWIPYRGASASEPPWTLGVSGYTITADYDTGQITVEGPGGRSVVPMWADNTRDKVTVDWTRETMTFHDPVGEVELVTVDFEILREAEMAFYGARDFGLQALLLSRSDRNWAILDLAEEIGDREHVSMLRVFDDQMILVTSPIPTWFWGSPREWSIKVTSLP